MFIYISKKVFYIVVAAVVTIGIAIFLLNAIEVNHPAIKSDGAIHKNAKASIIIDDFGQNRAGVKEMLSLKCPITIAVMPFLAFSQSDAKTAKQNGMEVIVHLPMRSTWYDIPSHIGKKYISVEQSSEEIYELTKEIIESLPEAVGVNVHMGALCSRDRRVMDSIMKAVKEKNMFFVDSKTTGKSMCTEAAISAGVPFGIRDVFLEHESTALYHVKTKLKLTIETALKNGSAIAIGHVGTEGGVNTAKAIDQMLPMFEENNVKIATVSELLQK